MEGVANDIDPLFIVHVAGSKIYADYETIVNDIESLYRSAEAWKETGACVVNKSVAKTNADNIKLAAQNLKNPAIKAEIPALRSEIDRVKEEYNKAATQSAELLDKVKVYDAQIEALYNTLDAKPTTEKPENKGIDWKWNNEPSSSYGFDAAKKDLLALQS